MSNRKVVWSDNKKVIRKLELPEKNATEQTSRTPSAANVSPDAVRTEQDIVKTLSDILKVWHLGVEINSIMKLRCLSTSKKEQKKRMLM